MDNMWKAAQRSRYGALASIDPGEASILTLHGAPFGFFACECLDRVQSERDANRETMRLQLP